MRTFLHNLHHAARSLRRSPAFTLAAVLTLALGLGANAAIFSLVDRLLLRPLPFPQPDRLAVVTEFRNPGYDNLSWPDFLDIQREASSFSGMAAFLNSSTNLTGDGEPERLTAGKVSWNLFEVLGVAPALGRGFTQAEGDMNGPVAAVLTHGLWMRRFGGDPSIVGRSLRLDGMAVQVAGVMPPGFEMPYQLRGVDIFLPLRLDADQQQARGSHFLGAVGRLAPGAGLAAARQETGAIVQRLAQAYPDTDTGYRAKVVPLQEEVVRRLKPLLWMLQAAVALVLLIACANIANLLLARGATRVRELAIRAALGADRRLLVLQLLEEGLVLAALGAAAGLGVAILFMRGLSRIMPLPPSAQGGLDFRVLAFTVLLAFAAMLLASLFPAWQAGRPDLQKGLREGAKGTASPRQRWLRQALVAAEVALATSLLIGAGLMIRSLWTLQAVDPGFKPDRVLITVLVLPKSHYAEAPGRRDFIARALDRAAQIPGVEAAAAVDRPPFGGSTSSSTYQVDHQPQPPDGPSVRTMRVSPAFFSTLGIPLRQGRAFQATEDRSAIVTANFAAKHWPGQDPLGHQITFGGDEGPWLTVVGVVADFRTSDLAEDPAPLVLLPLLDAAEAPGAFSLLLRGPASPEALRPGLGAALKDLDPDLPLSRLRSMDDLLQAERQGSEAKGMLFAAFGAVALLLAAVGIFGVTSFLVSQRTREIGIRMALGASLADILRLILGQGFRTLAAGLGAGLALAFGLGRALQSQLFGVEPLDPATYAAVLLLLSGVGLLACLLPALRAAKVDPMIALRSE